MASWYGPGDPTFAPAVMSTTKREAASCVKDGELWLLGGIEATGTTNAVEVYTPTTNAWRSEAPLGSLVTPNAKAAVIGDYIYHMTNGGLIRYDTTNGTSATMATPNSWHTSYGRGYDLHAYGGELYFGMETIIAQKYDPGANTWTSLAAFHAGSNDRDDSTALDDSAGTIYVHRPDATPTFGAYDIGTDIWTTLTDPPTPRRNAVMLVLSGMVYLISGYDPATGQPSDLVEVYDPGTDAWTVGDPLPVGLDTAMGGIIDGRIFIAGGYDAALDDQDALYMYADTPPLLSSTEALLEVAYDVHGDTLRVSHDATFPPSANLYVTHTLAGGSARLRVRYSTGRQGGAVLSVLYKTTASLTISRQSSQKVEMS
jgi:hypothetical protein